MTGGYRSFLGFTADGRRGVVILANTAVDADDLGFATLDRPAQRPTQARSAGVIQRINLLTAMVRKQSGRVIWIRHRGKTGDGSER